MASARYDVISSDDSTKFFASIRNYNMLRFGFIKNHQEFSLCEVDDNSVFFEKHYLNDFILRIIIIGDKDRINETKSKLEMDLKINLVDMDILKNQIRNEENLTHTNFAG